MTPTSISKEHTKRLVEFVTRLIDQERAQVLVEPNERSAGHWFGGGNLAKNCDGALLITGRYRNYGDSRTGLTAGTRGLELAIHVSRDNGRSAEKLRKWSKADLSYDGNEVLSIEGAALHQNADGTWELYVSTEKRADYPREISAFQKPGTGVWSIDMICGDSVEDLDTSTIRSVLPQDPPPGYLHVKDPKVFVNEKGATVLLFCDHPFSWSSVNTGYAVREPGESFFRVRSWEAVGRGPAWDVAGTRITCRLPVPRIGAFAHLPAVSVYFYDGLECYRQHDENLHSVTRPRGYSCEELGGAFAGFDFEFPAMTRLSALRPLFVSPHGTGCSRYVDVLVDEEGILATWQQSQEDLSQPLVCNRIAMEQVAATLA